jgi:hypothetical protein
VTVIVTERWWTRALLVPLTSIVYGPGATVLPTLTERVDVEPPVILGELSVGEIPVEPVAVSETVPVKPAMEVRPIMDVIALPCGMVRAAGVAVNEKSGIGAETRADTPVSCTIGQLVPTIKIP